MKTKFAALLILSTHFAVAQVKVSPSGSLGIGTTTPSSKAHIETYSGNQLRLVSTQGGLYNQAGIDFCTYNGPGTVARIAAEDQGSWRGNINFYCNGAGVVNSTTLRKVFQIDYLGSAYLYGNLYQQQTWMWSDKKIKENIVTCTDAMAKIKLLRGVTYDAKDSIEIEDNDILKSEKDIGRSPNTGIHKSMIAYGKCLNTKKQYGLIAQEVEIVIPEAVTMSKLGLKVVNYNTILPVMVEALKEQNQKIELLESKIKVLEGKKSYASSSARTGSNLTSTITSAISGNAGIESVTTPAATAYLYQNTPNPFSTETLIRYFLPDHITESFITVTDLNGKQLKLLKLSAKGEGSVTLKTNELTAGIYLYALVTDGNIADTKQMLIIE